MLPRYTHNNVYRRLKSTTLKRDDEIIVSVSANICNSFLRITRPDSRMWRKSTNVKIPEQNVGFLKKDTSNSEADASELLDNPEEMLVLYDIDDDFINRFNFSTTYSCVTRRKRVRQTSNFVFM